MKVPMRSTSMGLAVPIAADNPGGTTQASQLRRDANTQGMVSGHGVSRFANKPIQITDMDGFG